MKYRVIGALLGTFLPIATWSQAATHGGWLDDEALQRQLADGQVAETITFEGDGSRVMVNAAVRIKASAEVVWRVITDCDHAASFIPGVKRCKRVQAASDGTWEDIEQESKYSWLMPSVTTVVHADYKHRPQEIEFKLLSGDLKDEEGQWVLEADEHAPAHSNMTILEYRLHVEPGFWIPRVLMRHSLRAELPAALLAVRARAEDTTVVAGQ